MQGPLLVDGAVVCAGVRSAPLLAPFGLRAPLAGGARLSRRNAGAGGVSSMRRSRMSTSA